MIKFEKVSYEQFRKDCLNIIPDLKEEKIQYAYHHIKLPVRSSSGSAGYDFYSTFDFAIARFPETIPLGIRAIMPEDIVLIMVPRSGIGFKTGIALANTCGIIDSDYYKSSNEGHIMLKLTPGFSPKVFTQGERIVQGIFVHYIKTDDDCVTDVRDGGFGSSGK